MRTVKLDDPKLKKLIEQKKAFVLEGRGIAEKIDLVKEAKAKKNAELVEAEAKVDVKDLVEAAEGHIKELELLKVAVFDRVRENTPQQLRDDFDALDKQEQEMSQELNKMGHRVQKVKDKILPLVQKLGRPHLEDEFDDFSTTDMDENGIPTLTIFNHLEEWKTNFRGAKK